MSEGCFLADDTAHCRRCVPIGGHITNRGSAHLTKIAKAAQKAGLAWELDRQGGNHTIFKLDGKAIPIGRHAGEVGNRYAETVYKECQEKLGEGWWRK